MRNTIAVESITDRLLTERYVLWYLLCTLHMQECFQLQAIHFHIHCIFFPEVLLPASNFNKMSVNVYLLVNLTPLCQSYSLDCLHECENVSYPSDATVILPLHISVSHWERPFPSPVLNLSSLTSGMTDTQKLGVTSHPISCHLCANVRKRNWYIQSQCQV